MSTLVTIDIGGTHARFAIASVCPDGKIAITEPITLQTKDHTTFQSAWHAFRKAHGNALPKSIAFAIAGPIGGDTIRFTNNPWIIQPNQLPAQLDVDRITIVNDFAAIAHAVAQCGDSHLLHLAGPEGSLPDAGTITVVGPGTGLGVAMLLRDRSNYRVIPTEGGHIDFAPRDAIEDAILARLRPRHLRVSAERVVSGPAIVDIYATIAAIEGRAIVERSDVDLWTAAIDGSDPLAVIAMERFCMALGGVAGDLALAQGAKAVVIAGGLGFRLRKQLQQSAFADRFQAKGRFAPFMATLPVKLITHPQPGLIGAAAAFVREHLT